MTRGNKFQTYVCCAIFIIALFNLCAFSISAAAFSELDEYACKSHTSICNPNADFSASASEEGALTSGDMGELGEIFDFSGINSCYGKFELLGTGEGTAAGVDATGGYAKFTVLDDTENYGGGNSSFSLKYCGAGSVNKSFNYSEGTTTLSPIAAPKPLFEGTTLAINYIVIEFDIATDSLGFMPLSVYLGSSCVTPCYNSASGDIENGTSSIISELGTASPLFEIDADGNLIAEGVSRKIKTDGTFSRISIVLEISAKKSYQVINPDRDEEFESAKEETVYRLNASRAHIYADGEYTASAPVFSNALIYADFANTLGLDALEFKTSGSTFSGSACIDNPYIAYHNENSTLKTLCENPNVSLQGTDFVLNITSPAGIESAPVPPEENSGCNKILENIKLNISSYGYFVLNFYIPTSLTDNGEPIEILGIYTDSDLTNKLSGGERVSIKGEEYIHYHTKLGAADTKILSYYLSTSKGGITSKSELKYGLPYYAKSVMSDQTQSECAKRLIMNMVSYANSLISYLGTSTDTEIYTELLTLHNNYVTYLESSRFLEGGDIYSAEVAALDYKSALSECEYISGLSFFFGTYEPCFVINYSSFAKSYGISTPINQNGALPDTPNAIFIKIAYGNETPTFANHVAINSDGAELDINSPFWTASENRFMAYAKSNKDGEHPLFKITEPISITVSDGTSFQYSLAAYINSMLTSGESDAAELAKALYAYSCAISDFINENS